MDKIPQRIKEYRLSDGSRGTLLITILICVSIFIIGIFIDVPIIINIVAAFTSLLAILIPMIITFKIWIPVDNIPSYNEEYEMQKTNPTLSKRPQ